MKEAVSKENRQGFLVYYVNNIIFETKLIEYGRQENFREREFGTDCPHDSGDAGQYSPLCSLPIIDMGIYYCGYITCGMVLLFADGSVADQFSLVALPVIAGPLTIFFNRKDKNKGAKNYIDRVTGQIWAVFGVVGFCLSCMAFVVRIDILFVISLLMGMGATLTGLVCKYKPLSIAGMTGIALSFSMLFIHGSGVYLVFAAIFIVMMIVPGHIMNKQMKKQCLKN